MDDAALVSGLESFGDLLGDGGCFFDRDRSVRDPIRERRSFDELEHEGMDAVRLHHSVDTRDVWMIQRRENFRFSLEPSQALFVPRELFRKNFDRHVSSQLRIACTVDFSHSAPADRLEDLVVLDVTALLQHCHRPAWPCWSASSVLTADG